MVISFQKSIKAGTKRYLQMEGGIIDGFTQSSEAFQVELRHPADRLQLKVIFPAERSCRRAWIQQRSQNQTITLSDENWLYLPDGRQVVIWQLTNITQFEVYTFKWDW